MKKKTGAWVLVIAVIGFAFFAVLKIADVAVENEDLNRTNDAVTEIPISDIETIAAQKQNVLTKQEAEELCLDVLGDKAEETGFPISYRCIGAVSVNDKLYYVMNIAWLVNNNHWSYIGNCYVSADGREIYDGVVSSGKHEMTELRWKK